MNNKILVHPLMIIVAGMILISFQEGCSSKKEAPKQIPALKALEIKTSKVPVYLQMVGQAEGIPTVEIRARVEGYLKNWSFEEGSIVKKGQLLFTIEQDNYINNVAFAQADLASATAAWEKAKLDVARLKPLVATKAISQNDFDVAVTTEKQTHAAVQSAEANLAQAKLNLSYTTMYSPITGYIGAVQVRPGNLVGRGESTLLATVSAVDPMYINTQMNETDYLKIMKFYEAHKHQYQNVENIFYVYLTIADKSEYQFRGVVDFLDRDINPQTGTIALRAKVPNPSGLIKPGSFATVNLVLIELTDGIVIPQSATIQIQGKSFVFLINKENKVNRTPVLVGHNIGNQVLVLKGLKANDRILLEGFQKFQEGMHVKPILVQDTSKIPTRPGS